MQSSLFISQYEAVFTLYSDPV